MRRRWIRRTAALAGLLLPWPLAASAQLPPLPPPPPEGLESCVPRYGEAGCASRLYGQLLCGAVGSSTPVPVLRARLSQQFQQAGLTFEGLSAEQIETEAWSQQVPRLCPGRSAQIRQLFAP